MPQITNVKSENLKQSEERMPFGTSRSSNILRNALRKLPSAGGIPGETFYQVSFPAIEDFYDDQPDASERDTQDDINIEILPTLIEIGDLSTWPAGWNGYKALAPNYSAIQYAEHWMELFYQEVIGSGQNWMRPNVTASAEGEVVLEWWYGDKGLTIYIGNQSAVYLKDWGADINTEMEEGHANSPGIRQALWEWLMS
jgi:hypothetical protein